MLTTLLGQRKYLIEPDGLRFSYVYDPAGRISHLINPQGEPTTWTYDAASRVLSVRLANSTRTSYGYDKANQLLGQANLKPDGYDPIELRLYLRPGGQPHPGRRRKR